MLFFLQPLLAIDYTKGVFNIADFESKQLSLTNLNNMDATMSKSYPSMFNRMNSKIVFAPNRRGFTVLLGNKKLCLKGRENVGLCNHWDETDTDDWRFVDLSKGTSIRTKHLCLTFAAGSTPAAGTVGLEVTPCKLRQYAYFSIDKEGGGWSPFGPSGLY